MALENKACEEALKKYMNAQNEIANSLDGSTASPSHLRAISKEYEKAVEEYCNSCFNDGHSEPTYLRKD